jgi:hypothetical protein
VVVAVVQIEKVGITHDQIIDFLIANPGASQGEVARHFGYTQPWMSVIFNSEAFRERLAERREAIVDPFLRTTLEDRMKSVLDLSLEVLQEKLRETRNGNLAVRVLEHGSRALGYGARQTPAPVQVATYVAVVPAKALGARQWVEEHSPERVQVEVLTATGTSP